MAKLLLLNLFIMLLWPALNQEYTPQAFAFGFLGGLVVVTLLERSYGRRIAYAVGFLFYALWQIILSSISVAALVLHIGDLSKKLDPGILGIPLDAISDLEIMLLASMITLTPGTISMDLGKNSQGQQILYVHNLRIGPDQEDAFRHSIKDGFERRILRITRGEAA